MFLHIEKPIGPGAGVFKAPRHRAVHIKDNGMVRDTVYDGGNNALVLNKLRPLGELRIRSIKGAGGFIAGADYLEQETGRGGVIRQKTDFVQNKQLALIKDFGIGVKGFFGFSLAHFVDKIGGALEADAVTAFDSLIADGDGNMGFSPAGGPNGRHIRFFFNETAG